VRVLRVAIARHARIEVAPLRQPSLKGGRVGASDLDADAEVVPRVGVVRRDRRRRPGHHPLRTLRTVRLGRPDSAADAAESHMPNAQPNSRSSVWVAAELASCETRGRRRRGTCVCATTSRVYGWWRFRGCFYPKAATGGGSLALDVVAALRGLRRCRGDGGPHSIRPAPDEETSSVGSIP
jgi:hypothetical protein